MKRLIGCVAALCLSMFLVACGGISSSGTLAYVSNSSESNFTVFSVKSDGSLGTASISPVNLSANPKQLIFTPDGHFAYWIDSNGTTITKAKRSANGTFSDTKDFTVTGTVSSIVASSGSDFIYAALQSSKKIAVYSIDKDSGELSQITNSPFPVGSGITQLTLGSGGSFLFGVAPDIGAIYVWSLNTTSGTLTSVSGSPFAAGRQPTYALATSNGKFLYVTDFSSNRVYGFNLQSGSGILLNMAGSPFTVGNNPSALASSADSKYLFVTNQSDHSVSVLSVNSSTGELSNVTGSPFAVGTTSNNGQTSSTPVYVQASPLGSALYVVDSFGNKIYQYTINPDTGLLTPMDTASVNTGSNPVWITIK